MSRPKRVLILGTEGLDQRTDDVHLQCIPWEKIDTITNVSDADTIIFDLLALSDPESVDWSKLFRILTPRVGIADILFPGGRLIFLGNPAFQVRWNGDDQETFERPFLWWTGFKIEWDPRPGQSVQNVRRLEPEDRDLSDYLSHVRWYERSVRSYEIDNDVVGAAFDLEWMKQTRRALEPAERTLITNRYGGRVAFALGYRIVESSFGSQVVRAATGDLLFLPMSELDHDDALILLLRDFFQIEVAVPEPVWVGSMMVTGQGPYDEQIQLVDSELARLKNAREQALHERARIRQPLRLLFDTGAGLEGIVLDVLEELGAKVKRPTSPGLEDGWINVRTAAGVREGVLEIKGTRNRQFKEDGLKQVVTWVDRGIQREKKRYKGVFIGNANIGNPPAQRVPAFSAGFTTNAKLHQIVALRTEDLFRCLELKRTGKLDQDAFWDGLFGTDGIYECGPCQNEDGATPS